MIQHFLNMHHYMHMHHKKWTGVTCVLSSDLLVWFSSVCGWSCYVMLVLLVVSCCGMVVGTGAILMFSLVYANLPMELNGWSCNSLWFLSPIYIPVYLFAPSEGSSISNLAELETASASKVAAKKGQLFFKKNTLFASDKRPSKDQPSPWHHPTRTSPAATAPFSSQPALGDEALGAPTPTPGRLGMMAWPRKVFFLASIFWFFRSVYEEVSSGFYYYIFFVFWYFDPMNLGSFQVWTLSKGAQKRFGYQTKTTLNVFPGCQPQDLE